MYENDIIKKQMNGNKIHYANIKQKKKRSLFETKNDELRESNVLKILS